MSTDGFTHVPFSALAEVNPPRGALKLSLDSEVSFIPMGDVTESGRWVGRQTRRFVEVRNGFTNFAEGDVLMAKITPCMENGKGCLARGLVNGVGFGSTEFHVLRAKPESDSGYIHQWSLHAALRKQAKNSMTGSAGQQRVPSGFFDQFRIPAFPQPEQAKIAEVLGAVDRAIEETEALVAKQQRLKAGLMQDLLTRGIDAHGQLRAESTHAFKDSPLGRIPVDWEVRTLDHCVERNAPICYGILMPGTGFDGGVPVVKVRDIVGGTILQDNLLLTDPKIDGQYKRSRLRAGDLLITIRGTTGRIAPVPASLDGANITQDTARLRIDPAFSAEFFFFLLQSKLVQDQVELHTVGQAVKGINIGDVRRIAFGLPGSDEQKEIAARLSAQEAELGRCCREALKLRSLKTALMQDLLTGRRRVTVLLPA